MHTRALASILFLTTTSTYGQELMVERVADVLNPTYVTQAPGETDRLFVCSQRRGVDVVIGGVTLGQMFLDVNAEAAANGGLHTHGLMSMAFHPDYQNNGKFYVAYMDNTLMAHVAEYRVSANDANLADRSTRVQILGPYQMGFQSHNWNHLWFGPDGMLYLSTGDDQQTGQSVLNVGQDLTSHNGKILRLDVNGAPPYVPADNPFVGIPGVDERVFMYGLRQPWRTSYDPVGGYFFVGDVGAQDREEISVVDFASAAGANFGWRCLEGTQCTNFGTGCPLGCNDQAMIDPIFEYPHDQGRCAMIGGYVYRGAAIPSLQGHYLFADYCSARFWSFTWNGSSLMNFQERTADLMSCDGSSVGLSVSFGVDNAGELYICDIQHDVLWRIVPEAGTSSYCVTTPNSAGSGALISSSGSTSISANTFTLDVSGAPSGQFGLFYYGPEQVQNPLGNGVGCVGPGALGFFRLSPPSLVDASGNASRLLDFGLPPADSGPGQIVAGSSWNFQYWYRDPAAGGANYDFSDALAVTFCP